MGSQRHPCGPKWVPPVPAEYFAVTQPYLHEDWALYPEFGHHVGVDYSGGAPGIPLLAVAAGEIVYSNSASSHLGAVLGNHTALYVPGANCSFLYCHLAGAPPALGSVAVGEQLGVMGETGQALGIHLHLEGYRGRFTRELRCFTSLADIKAKTFDADAFLQAQLAQH